jgi:DNA polymerase III gamma/tau subunit
MTEVLHVKYRPLKFEHVLGQDHAIRTLRASLGSGSQAFLLYGNAGTGKTTLARIAANHLGCEPQGILEIDAASNTGVDNMRDVQQLLQYRAFGKSDQRAVIVDECHRLSGAAFDSLLKIIEEPPAHVHWFFCTTNITKVPATIRSRCIQLAIADISAEDLGELVDGVCGEEDIKLAEGVHDMIIREARGSARQALVNLEAARNCKNKKEAAHVLRTTLETDATIALARFLMSGGSWEKCMSIVDGIDTSPEGTRLVILNYLTKVARGAKTTERAQVTLQMMQAFSYRYDESEGHAPLLLSLGAVLFQPN